MTAWIRDLSARLGTFGLLVVAIVLVNAIAGIAAFRWDMTEEKLFTLSKGTQEFLEGLDGEVTFKLFRSHSVSGLPLQLDAYGRRVEDLLKEYVKLSGGKITLEVYDPKPDSEEEEWALKYGLQGVPLGTGESAFLGLVLLMEGEENRIPYLDPRREQYLEYDVTQALTRLVHPGKKKLGILSSLDVVSDAPPGLKIPGVETPQSWIFADELRKLFDVVKVDAKGKELPEGLDVLMVIHPKDLDPALLYAIDQFFMAGHPLLVFVDPLSRVEQLSSPGLQQSGTGALASRLEPLLGAYGVEVPEGEVVADLRYAARVNAGAAGIVPYPVWMELPRTSMNQDVLITANLERMFLLFAGQIRKKEGAAQTFTPLVRTSSDGGTLKSFYLRFTQPDQLARQVEAAKEPLTLAALVQGTFSSAYPSGPPEGVASSATHLAKSQSENSLLVMADSDFLYDDNAVRKLNFFGQTLAQPINDNLNFIANAAEFLGGDDVLISIRSRGTFARPFTRVAELQAKAQKKWQAEEEKLSARIREIQERLNKLTSKREGNQFVLTPEQVQEIDRVRAEMSKAKRARREVRRKLREDIESLQNRILMANLLLVPGLLTAFVIARLWLKRNKA